MTKISKKKYTEGSIIAIPLPDGRYAFAKAYREPTFGIYKLISNEIPPLEVVTQSPFAFFQASTDIAIKKGEWPVIGEQPFKHPDDTWGPALATFYVRETNEWTVWETPHVDYRGQILKATLEQVKDMDIMSVCIKPEQLVEIIIDRVIHGNHEPYKVRS